MGRVVSVSLVLLITSAYLLKTAEARNKRDLGESIAEGVGRVFRSLTWPLNAAAKASGAVIKSTKIIKNFITGDSYESGVIFLNGYVTPGVANEGFYAALRLGLASSVRVMVPSAPKRLDTDLGCSGL